MTRLLRQAHGFEGFHPSGVNPEATQLVFMHGPYMHLVLLNRHSASPPPCIHPQHRDHVITSVDQLLQIGVVVIESAECVSKPRPNTIETAIHLKVAQAVNSTSGS